MSSNTIIKKDCYLKVVVFFVNLKQFHGVTRFLKNIFNYFIFMNDTGFYIVYEP